MKITQPKQTKQQELKHNTYLKNAFVCKIIASIWKKTCRIRDEIAKISTKSQQKQWKWFHLRTRAAVTRRRATIRADCALEARWRRRVEPNCAGNVRKIVYIMAAGVSFLDGFFTFFGEISVDFEILRDFDSQEIRVHVLLIFEQKKNCFQRFLIFWRATCKFVR